MAGDQEGDHLVADVLGVQPGAVRGAHRTEHQAEQVLGGALGALPRPGGDHLVDHGGQVVGVGPEGRVALAVVQLRVAGELGHRPVQAAHHRLDEGVRLVPVEGAEVEAEAGQPDGVQGHPGHVAGHVHRQPGGGRPSQESISRRATRSITGW